MRLQRRVVSLARVVDPSRKAMLASLGAMAFILVLGGLDQWTHGAIDLPALIPPFGASTVIVFFAPETLASRAWNVIVGHLGSALAAALVLSLLPEAPLALNGALAVAGAGLWMVLSRSVHPPGGATALFAVLGGRALHLGALLPLLAGCALLVGTRWLLDTTIALRTRLATITETECSSSGS
jgi:CBS domain-containing membrane protein